MSEQTAPNQDGVQAEQSEEHPETAPPQEQEKAAAANEGGNTVPSDPNEGTVQVPAQPTETSSEPVPETKQEPSHEQEATNSQSSPPAVTQESDQPHQPGQIVDAEATDPAQEGSEPQTQPSHVDNEVKAASSTVSGDSDPLAESPKEETPAIKVEKQPAVGQLQLKELLSGTSIQIVEHAQKLADAPLIGTITEEQPPRAPSHTAPQIPDIVVGSEIQSSAHAADDQFPGPDHEELPFVHRHPSLANTVAPSEDDSLDTEPYDIYTIPEGADKLDECPSILKRHLQTYNDDRLPIARYFKLEDEDKLNEAAGWDIQPSYQSKPSCFIRCSVLEKVLRGILEFRLSKYALEGIDAKTTKQLLPVLGEDVATTLAQCRFHSYKYTYFVSIVSKNRQDVVISTRQIWDPTTDRRVIAKMDNRKFHASVVVHFIFHP